MAKSQGRWRFLYYVVLPVTLLHAVVIAPTAVGQETPSAATEAEAPPDGSAATSPEAAQDPASLLTQAYAYLSGTEVDQDLGKAEDLFRQAVAAGVEDAAKGLMIVGYARAGSKTADDLAAAAALFDEAAEAGAADALVPLGYAYQQGLGVAEDKVKAVALFQKAVDAKVDAALVPLGFAALSGSGMDQDLGRAARLFEQALTAKVEGASNALLAVAYTYQQSDAPADTAEALRLFQEAADAGTADALVPLAYAYQNGKGVAADPARAAELFAKAADEGATGALIPLGFAYLGGVGIERNIDLAADTFLKAVDQNVENADGALVAAGYTFQEAGGQDNIKRSLELFQVAADAGAGSAFIPLGFAYLNGTGVPKDLGRAGEFLLSGVEANVEGAGDALSVVVSAYQKQGGASNLRSAAALLEKAVEHGDKKSMTFLGRAYLRGDGVKADRVRAFELFSAAAKAGLPKVGTELYWFDQNAYVQLIQSHLAEKGYLTGRQNGLADARTLRALSRFCRDAGIANVCRAGPLLEAATDAVLPLLVKND